MGVIQENFLIPDDIAVGLATGIYRRIGGVVRWAVGQKKGQIVKHLKPALPANENAETLSIVEKAIIVQKKNKKVMLGAAAIVAVAGGGGIILASVKAKKRNAFQKAFKDYVDAMREGNMSVEIIDKLEGALINVKTVRMKASELDLLVSHIREYTLRLAELNQVKMTISETSQPIIDLKQYLEVQKNILMAA